MMYGYDQNYSDAKIRILELLKAMYRNCKTGNDRASNVARTLPNRSAVMLVSVFKVLFAKCMRILGSVSCKEASLLSVGISS